MYGRHQIFLVLRACEGHNPALYTVMEFKGGLEKILLSGR